MTAADALLLPSEFLSVGLSGAQASRVAQNRARLPAPSSMLAVAACPENKSTLQIGQRSCIGSRGRSLIVPASLHQKSAGRESLIRSLQRFDGSVKGFASKPDLAKDYCEARCDYSLVIDNKNAGKLTLLGHQYSSFLKTRTAYCLSYAMRILQRPSKSLSTGQRALGPPGIWLSGFEFCSRSERIGETALWPCEIVHLKVSSLSSTDSLSA